MGDIGRRFCPTSVSILLAILILVPFRMLIA